MLLRLLDHFNWISVPQISSQKLWNELVSSGIMLTRKSVITSTSLVRKTKVTLKNNSVLKFDHIGEVLDPKTDFKNQYKDSLDEWSKRFCLQIVIHLKIKNKLQL